MIRNIGAAVTGLAIAYILIAGIEKLGHMIYPPPADFDFNDPDAMRDYVASLPPVALLFPMFAWFIATFTGSLVACKIGTASPLIFTVLVGMIVLALTIANLIFIPHPLWFSVIAVIGIIASAWLALHLANSSGSDATWD